MDSKEVISVIIRAVGTDWDGATAEIPVPIDTCLESIKFVIEYNEVEHWFQGTHEMINDRHVFVMLRPEMN